ncbi:hypothetical protein VRRI112168_10800 [Vreelandella rituensis]|uniref:Uncharacterized protein n=1 Tax=Vreelandella rituensis TaxID=2282306 RepID=A0A368TZX2_9GAMM|nr:hypothetical protein [Halomonas rituensis]RCV90304.1 hypothetical protein DU506_11860 [Halomonas rituensis]
MAAIDYLNRLGLHVEPLPGNRISVWPVDNITSDVRVWIREHKPDLLRELLAANDNTRIAWRVVRNGKPMTMLGKVMTYEEALESAQGRWPRDDIRVEHNY